MARKSKYEKLYIYKLSDEEIQSFVVQDILRQFPDAKLVSDSLEAIKSAGRDEEVAFFHMGPVERKKETATTIANFWIQQKQRDGFGKEQMKSRLVNVVYTLNDYDCQNSNEPNRKTMHKDWVNMIYQKNNDVQYVKNALKYEKEVLNKPETVKFGAAENN